MASPVRLQPGQAPDPLGLARQNLGPMLKNLFGDAADTVLAGLFDDRQQSDRIIVDADLSHLRNQDRQAARADRIHALDVQNWERVITGSAPAIPPPPGI